MSGISELRAILLETSARADYTQPMLREQIEEVDLMALGDLLAKTRRSLAVFEHAYECMQVGTHKHPMQALLHATECVAATERPLNDGEFFSSLKAWGIMCEAAHRANTAKSANVGRQISTASLDAFERRFMRGE